VKVWWFKRRIKEERRIYNKIEEKVVCFVELKVKKKGK